MKPADSCMQPVKSTGAGGFDRGLWLDMDGKYYGLRLCSCPSRTGIERGRQLDYAQIVRLEVCDSTSAAMSKERGSGYRCMVYKGG